MQYKSPDPKPPKSLKNLRIARSLSQEEVAAKIGTNANTISRWERGVAVPSLYYRRQLADFFGVDPQELFSDLNDEDGSAVGYVNIDIHVTPDPQQENLYLVTASTTGRKKDAVTERLSFLTEETCQSAESCLISVGARAANTPATHDHAHSVRDLGKHLFNSLISGEVRSFYDNKRQEAINNSKILRLRLILVPLDLVALPWETMFDEREGHSGYLCLTKRPKTILVRSVDGATYKRDNSARYDPPLRILGMIADPPDLPSLQPRSEKEMMEEALQPLVQDEKVYLEWKPGRVSELDDLRYSTTDRWDILHFIGHGRFDTSNQNENGEGELAFENEYDKDHAIYIPTEHFGESLPSATKLVVLNAGEKPGENHFGRLSNMAHSLATQKIPAVVAMQFPMLETASNRFSKIFYTLLAKGTAVDEAVAEARREIYKTAEDQDCLDWAAPILYISSPNVFSFKADAKPRAALPLTVPDELPATLPVPLETEIEGNPLITTPVPLESPPRPPFTRIPPRRRIYILVVGIIISMLVLGGIFLSPSFLPQTADHLFPALCGGNFQSTNTSIVSIPATSTSPDGESIGLSEGEYVFDRQRPNQQEVQYKLQAAQATTNDPQNVVSSLINALSIDQADAEAQIYLENWRVLNSNHPHITFVVGVTFTPSFAGASRGTLQGAFTAQKECNNLSRQDSSKTQIVLIIANIGGSNSENRASSAKVVADQIANQAGKDSTIVGIMGWLLSADSINVNHQLKIRGSNLPMVSPISASDELEGMSHFFRVCPTNREQIQIAANFLLNTKHKKKIAVIYDQTNSYSNNLKDDIYKDIKNNVVGSASFTGGNSKTLQDALRNVLAQNPDAIFFAGYVVDLVELLNDISSTPSANLLIMGGNALGVTNDYQTPLPDLHNVYFTAYASPNQWNSTGQTPPFFQEYKDNFQTDHASNGLPNIDEVTMLSYDALLALLYGSQQVLSTKNTINASDLTHALKQITGSNAIQGITGRIIFDSKGDQDPSKMIFVEHIQKTNLVVEHTQRTNLVIDETHGCLQKDKCSL